VRIVVPVRAVPDLVEEIELTADETGIDRDYLKFVVSEWDEQALEEALLVKDSSGADVVAVGLASDPDIDQALYTALAKGADSAVKITGGDGGLLTGGRAALLAGYLAAEPADLVITGVQAADDIDGQLPPMLAAHLGQPHVSVAVGVMAVDDPAAAAPAPAVRRLFRPEQATHAEMLDGDADEVAEAIADLLRSRGLVKG